ncbi:MAG: retron St85 family effector protein [Acidobacteria bacterium]|nr:retron St85 family effector protein [Acidobacteriota bacterium]
MSKLDFSRHPASGRARERLVVSLRRSAARPSKLKPLVLLCGREDSPRRARLREYLAQRPNSVLPLVFYAEDVWMEIQASGRNMLELEEELARLADLVVVIVESAGSIAELGAFALSEPLRRRMLAILDRRYLGQRSFINFGPVSLIDKYSRFGKAIYCDLDAILLSGEDIFERLSRATGIGRPLEVDRGPISNQPKQLMFLVADIVFIAGPLTAEQCDAMVEEVVGKNTSLTTKEALAILKALAQVTVKRYKGADYYSAVPGAGISAEASPRVDELPRLRAQYLGGLSAIPEWRQLFRELA